MNVLSSSNKAEPFILDETFDGVSCYTATSEHLLSFIPMPMGTSTKKTMKSKTRAKPQKSKFLKLTFKAQPFYESHLICTKTVEVSPHHSAR